MKLDQCLTVETVFISERHLKRVLSARGHTHPKEYSDLAVLAEFINSQLQYSGTDRCTLNARTKSFSGSRKTFSGLCKSNLNFRRSTSSFFPPTNIPFLENPTSPCSLVINFTRYSETLTLRSLRF